MHVQYVLLTLDDRYGMQDLAVLAFGPFGTMVDAQRYRDTRSDTRKTQILPLYDPERVAERAANGETTT
jgi:hypothetical protein